MNRNCVAGWGSVWCPMVNFKFYCRAFFVPFSRKEGSLMVLNEMEKRQLFQVEGDSQPKVLDELYHTAR